MIVTRRLLRSFALLPAALVLLPLLSGCGAPPAAAGPSSPAAEEALVVCLGRVDVEGGLAHLAPAQPGRVVEVLVHDDDTVSAGAVLLRLDSGQARQDVEAARAGLSLAQTRLAQAEQEARQHAPRLQQLSATLEAARHRLADGRIRLRRSESLARSDLAKDADVEAAREQVAELTAAALAAEGRLAEMQAVDPELAVEAGRQAVRAARARLAGAEHVLADHDLRAPCAGRVVAVEVRPGEVLGGPGSSGSLLFCPDRPLVVCAEVEQELLERVAVGSPARLRKEGKVGPSWSGEVVSVGSLFQRRQHRTDPTQLSDVPTVECRIRLDRDHPLLRIGERVTVSIYPPQATTLIQATRADERIKNRSAGGQ
jgi:multidrug resistance efflux pump